MLVDRRVTVTDAQLRELAMMLVVAEHARLWARIWGWATVVLYVVSNFAYTAISSLVAFVLGAVGFGCGWLWLRYHDERIRHAAYLAARDPRVVFPYANLESGGFKTGP